MSGQRSTRFISVGGNAIHNCTDVYDRRLYVYRTRKQTCVTCTAVQMVTAEWRYECITCSFLIDECQFTKFFQRLHRQLCETLSFYVTRHHASRRGTVHSPSLEESILIVVPDRPESSTRFVTHHVSVIRQTVCRVLYGCRLHSFPFHRVQALNTADYPFRLNFCQ
ncbi:hypothetical protein TNCV_5072521 [Trichonephila clavipes]|nr:hypothetical protein TNCV_5072521 [Trichonephila clavipes]